jgi:hypothetical protein
MHRHKLVEIKYDGKKAVLLQKVLKRAKSRAERKTSLRHPVELEIEGVRYLFTEKEIKQGFQNQLDIEKLPREQIRKQKDLIIKLSRHRDTAFRLQAAQAATACSVQ